ncbi:cell wall hydrolase [Aurantiacibacter spongiae]|uniref:Cell wall hydrolase n=2 Tax=Aurantiacibacter spongiae TaxID=2488860 RepID=A0A3N5CVD6_9SPHN|nr:cell wall hydrolase [Aurantiacibacter spongiae]
MLFAHAYGAAGAEGIPQPAGQGEPVRLEVLQTEIETTSGAEQPEIRFVQGEVVQEVPPQPVVIEPTEHADTEAASLRELVGQMDGSAELPREVMCLAQAVYFEARGEPLDGQLAVARVIVNRADSSRFPDDYCSVITQRAQFSFVRGGHIPAPNRGTAAWRRAKAIARIADRDLWDSEADDALYFHATRIRPRWAGRLTARATIDSHIFYR